MDPIRWLLLFFALCSFTIFVPLIQTLIRQKENHTMLILVAIIAPAIIIWITK